MIKADVVATGSTGNFCVIEDCVAIDVGVPFKVVEPYLSGLKLVLLSHEHGDHFKASTIRRMALEKPLLRFGCGPFLVKKLVDAGVARSQIDVLQARMMYGYGICNVIPVELFHDVPNYGYKLHFASGKVFYATDTGNLNGIAAKDYDLYLVESNYKLKELQARMDAKIEAGEFPYERRSLKYHLSEEKCNDWLYRNMGRNSEYIYMHQHVDREFGHEG
ncbi:MAG: hypothetical protein IJ594_03495 [Oscillospiraceae bacterium]|nr:hypothetical protein [Oscillospiraceae bacterium]